MPKKIRKLRCTFMRLSDPDDQDVVQLSTWRITDGKHTAIGATPALAFKHWKE